MQKFMAAVPALEHAFLMLLIGGLLGSYVTLQATNQITTKTQAAVHDALKGVPVAAAAPSASKE
ncbi:hypothetical protein AHiyo6_00450 [Arthrobacter sp. Hiyo6]|nr:hypothetical protein AHiyo6_00450 [Arthrobacter sp. Hiyo6]